MASCHRAMVERTKGRRPKNRPSDTKGRRPKNRPAKGGTLEATWMRGEGTPEPWRRGATYFLQVVAATACASVTSSKPTPLGMGCLWLASGTCLLGPSSLYALRTSWTMPAVRVQVLVFLDFVYWLSLLYTNAPDLFGGRGEMAMAVPCCHSFYGTACAFGLTWRPFTGSLYLSSFWCRLKPGPSGERGRKSGLLQDMLVTGLGPTSERVDGRVQAWTRLALDSFKGSNPVWRATGHNEPVDGRVQTWTRHGRAIIPRTDGQRPKDRSVTINPQGWETVFGRYPRQYAVVLTYYWVRGRVTSLVGLFVFPFVLFGHFFVFRGPGAGASGHTGSLPGCAERGVLCPGGG